MTEKPKFPEPGSGRSAKNENRRGLPEVNPAGHSGRKTWGGDIGLTGGQDFIMTGVPHFERVRILVSIPKKFFALDELGDQNEAVLIRSRGQKGRPVIFFQKSRGKVFLDVSRRG